MNESMLFSVGNTIIHPAYGAGIIVDVTNIVTQKVRRQLYKIKLRGTLNTLIEEEYTSYVRIQSTNRDKADHNQTSKIYDFCKAA